jgi:phytoene dehydrogenase-like protein
MFFEMREHWDVIIIGDGMGGLTAAAHLVKASLRVLVGFSHTGLIKTNFEDLKIGENLKFSRVHYHIRDFGLDLPLSLPFSELVKELAKYFPAEAEAVQQFFEDMNELMPKQKADPNRS